MMFKVGDRVTSKVEFGYEGGGKRGMVGTIKAILKSSGHYAIVFDNFKDGHNNYLGDWTTTGGWVLSREHINLAFQEPLENE